MAISHTSIRSEASRIAEFLDLPDWQDMDDFGLVEHVRKGFPAATARNVVRRFDPDGRILKATDIIPKATLSRREAERQPLSQEESERILALSRVLAELDRIYHGDAEKMTLFLIQRHPLLGGKSPLSLATGSIAGADLVFRHLQRADAGVAV